ncbi:hypothetical protein ACROYT_G016433 [Oculina patagonica]
MTRRKKDTKPEDQSREGRKPTIETTETRQPNRRQLYNQARHKDPKNPSLDSKREQRAGARSDAAAREEKRETRKQSQPGHEGKRKKNSGGCQGRQRGKRSEVVTANNEVTSLGKNLPQSKKRPSTAQKQGRGRKKKNPSRMCASLPTWSWKAGKGHRSDEKAQQKGANQPVILHESSAAGEECFPNTDHQALGEPGRKAKRREAKHPKQPHPHAESNGDSETTTNTPWEALSIARKAQKVTKRSATPPPLPILSSQ